MPFETYADLLAIANLAVLQLQNQTIHFISNTEALSFSLTIFLTNECYAAVIKQTAMCYLLFLSNSSRNIINYQSTEFKNWLRFCTYTGLVLPLPALAIYIETCF